MRLTALLIITTLTTGFLTLAAAQQQRGAYGDSEFRLGPEDVIEVSVYQEKDLSTVVPVRPDGKISIPLIGEMPASGKTATELQKEITQRYSRFIAEPAVTVVVKEVNSPKVSVGGEVKNPGMYKIGYRATLLDVLALAGGTTEYAKKDKIHVIRVDSAGAQQTIRINLDDQYKGKKGKNADPFFVLPYDKVWVQ
jgi:polysaccharide biosynthesis/export protein